MIAAAGCAIAVAMTLTLALTRSALAGESRPLLPDITVTEGHLRDNDIVQVGSRRLLRLSNGTPNIGEGPFYVYGQGAPSSSETEPVRQRIYREDGSFFERDAGQFLYHPSHNHIHVDNWARYRLRHVVGEDGVGDVVAEGEKTSFCILDLGVHDRNLPGFPRNGQFRSCSSRLQGLSVGWLDIYDKSLAGQDIDITGVPDGFYWLESEVDPDNNFVEADEENNVKRVRITIGTPTVNPNPDTFEPNEDRASVEAMPLGSPQSSNLGPVDPKRSIENLTIHDASDVDYFRFYVNSTGTSLDFLRIDFSNSRGNLDLDLLRENGTVVSRSETSSDVERIGLEGVPEGWYFARVRGRDGAVNRDYEITINPPSNEAPSLDLLNPEAGETRIRHGLDLYVVNWSYEDAESDQAWVTLYFSETGTTDDLVLVPTTLQTPAEFGFVVINTAEMKPGTYFVYGQITDGGRTIGSFAPGLLTLVEIPDRCVGNGADCNENGIDDACDIEFSGSFDCDGNGILDECDIAAGAPDTDLNGVPDRCERPVFHRGDVNDDGAQDVSDSVSVLNYLFSGSFEPSCAESADVNNDTRIDVTDVIYGLGFLFSGGEPPPAPGPVASPCGADPDAVGSAGDLGCVSYQSC